jgi:WD40 repeat protein
MGDFPALRVWDVRTAKELWSLTEQTEKLVLPSNLLLVQCLAFFPDSSRMVVCLGPGSGPLQIYETATGKRVGAFDEASRDADAVMISTDGAWALTLRAAATETHGVELWSTATGKLDPVRSERAIQHSRFCPDGRLVIEPSGTQGEVIVFRPDRAYPNLTKLVRRLWSVEPWYLDYADSRDGKYQVSESGENSLEKKAYLVLRSAATGEEIRRFDRREGGIDIAISRGESYALAFSLDGKCVLSADGDAMLRRWDVETGHLVWAITAANSIPTCAFSDDARLLVTACGEDRPRPPAPYRQISIKIWDAEKGALLHEVVKPQEPPQPRDSGPLIMQ